MTQLKTKTVRSLKDRLCTYMFKRHSAWIASTHLEKLVAKQTTYSPSNVSRRLRELREEGKLESKLERGIAFYRARTLHNDLQDQLHTFDV